MNRWSPRFTPHRRAAAWQALLWLGAMAALASAAAQSLEARPNSTVGATSPEQIVKRTFPPGTQRATLVVVQAPIVMLNGAPDRLSPGSRIRDQRNMLALSASLSGQSLLVNYRRDAAGLIHDVWTITPQEAQDKLPGAAPATNIRYASEEEAPASDDGKTPYRLLPGLGAK